LDIRGFYNKFQRGAGSSRKVFEFGPLAGGSKAPFLGMKRGKYKEKGNSGAIHKSL